MTDKELNERKEKYEKEKNEFIQNNNEHIEWLNSLSKKDRRLLYNCLNIGEKLPMAKNPTTSEKNISEIQNMLINDIISYCDYNELDDIHSVSFLVDNIQDSVEVGKWCPSTDSYISVHGIEDNGKGYPYRYETLIGEIL